MGFSAALLATGSFSAAATAVGTSIFAGITGSILGQLLISTVLGAALQALAPKPSSGVNRGYQTNSLGSAADRAYLW